MTTEIHWLWSVSTNSAESQILQIILYLSKYCIHLILSDISLSDKTPVEYMCVKSG